MNSRQALGGVVTNVRWGRGMLFIQYDAERSHAPYAGDTRRWVCRTLPYFSPTFSSRQYRETGKPDTCAPDPTDLDPACSALPQPRLVTVLSIDAWRDGEGWAWNQWHRVGEWPAGWLSLSPRRLLRAMREEGYLGKGSVGRVAIEDDQYNLIVVDRHTREPLFALPYGEHES